jgi:hypothetical protein
VVTEKYRGAAGSIVTTEPDCNHGAIGYYGHIVRLSHDGSRPMAHVAFQGRISGLPADDYYLSFGTAAKPFPLYESEIEHAD